MEGGEEYEEEHVWSVLKEREASSPEMKMSKSKYHLFSASSSSSSSKGNEVSARAKESSSPMNVPKWSNINGNTRSNHLHSWVINDVGSMVPPHEVVAKRLARTQTSCFSMCEGIGRTLKGRDLSKTRNDVLTKTGFLERNITSPPPPPP